MICPFCLKSAIRNVLSELEVSACVSHDSNVLSLIDDEVISPSHKDTIGLPFTNGGQMSLQNCADTDNAR